MNTWEITYRERGFNNTKEIDALGILSALEAFFRMGHSADQVVKIEVLINRN